MTLRQLKQTEEALRDAEAKPTKEEAHDLQHPAPDTRFGEIPLHRGEGCDQCNGAGLRGRQGLYEVMFMTQHLRKLILQNVGAAESRDAAIEEGMLTLRMDGWLKIIKGITTIEQVVRETSV